MFYIEKNDKPNRLVRILKLKKLLLTDYSVQLQLILGTNTMKFLLQILAIGRWN